MKNNQLISRRAFTLVELLVVIAIIMILIALLIGPLMRARRGALVLACPIVAPGMKGSVVIIHPHGSAELEIAPAPSRKDSSGGPGWSSNGTWIGYVTNDKASGNGNATAIVRVASGKIRIYPYPMYNSPERTAFNGWADDDHFFDGSGPDLYIREAATGAITQKLVLPYIGSGGIIEGIARVPPSTGAYYVARVNNTYTSPCMIVLLRKDFSIKKTIHLDTSGISSGESAGPRIDPMGEYVAWTTRSSNRRCAIAVKALNAPMSAPPQVINVSAGVLDLTFADWTEGGDMLVFDMFGIENVAYSAMYLKIFTRSGKPLCTVMPTDQWGYPGCASYRKYMHQ